MESNNVHQLRKRVKELEDQNEQLQKSLHLYQNIVDNHPLGIQVFDRDGYSFKVNQAQRQLLGLPEPEEGVGRFNVLTDPYSKAMGADKKYAEVYNGQSYEHEFEYQLDSQNNRWNTRREKRIFHETIFPVKDERGNVEFAVAVLEDKTEQRRTEESLRNSEERNRITLNSIGDGVISTDTDGRIFQMNRVARYLTGWDIEEAKGRSFQEVFRIFNAFTGEEATNPVNKVLEEGTVQGLANHTKLIAKDGREYQIGDSAGPIKDDQGQTHGVVVVFRDVTEQYKKNEQIKQYKALLAESQRIAHVGSWELDLTQNQLTWSDEVYNIFGLVPRAFEATFEAFLKRVHPDDRQAVSEAYQNSIREGRDQYEIQHRIIRENTEEIRYVHEKCEHVRDESGAIVKSVGMVQDFTERKQAEMDLKKKNEELETAEEELRSSNEELQQINYKLEEQKEELEIYRRMVEGAGDMMAAVNKHYKYISANRAYARFYQLNEGELLGHELKDIISEKYFRERVKPNVDRCLEGEAVHYEMYRYNPDYSKVYLEISYYPLWKDGAIDGAIAVMRDITDRKEAEEELLIKNRISNAFINSKRENFYKEVLDVFRDVFSSEYGFFGYINHKGDLVSESLTRDVWNECQIEQKSIVFPKDSWAGVWGDSLKQRKTLYKNGNLQLPEGHVQLTSALAAPIMADDQLIGQIALANKPEGYDENDKEQMKRLCGYIAPLMHAVLQEEQYKKELLEAKDRAEKSEDLLEAAMENSQAGIAIAGVPSGKLKFGNEKGLAILNGNYEALEENEKVESYGGNWQIFHLDGTPGKVEEFPLTKAVHQGETSSEEFLLRRNNGQVNYVLSNAAPVRDAQGEQTGAIVVFLDITRRKQVETKRDEYLKQLTSTLDSVDSLLVVIDPHYRIVLSNWKDHEWVPEEKRLQRPYCYEVLKNRDIPCENCPLNEAFKDGQYREYEDRNPVDGSYKAISVIPIFKDNGKVQHVLENVRDVTERKQAEEKIKKSESELTAIYENAPFIMMLLDQERRVRKINRFGEQFTGASSEKLIGLKGGAALNCAYHFKDPRGCGFGPFCHKCPISTLVRETFQTGRSYERVESTLPFMIGGGEKELTLLVSTSPINFDEEPLVLVSILDITERKDAERALAEGEEKYRQIFNNTNDAMYLHETSPDGEPGRIIEVNNVACNMLGYSREQLINKTPRDIDDPVFASQIPEIKTILEEKGEVTFETQHVASNGSRIPVEVSAHMFELKDETLVLSAVRDISERKNAEENVYRSLEKEKEVNQMKSRFISMVSHEFRTPLANIHSSIQMFQRYGDKLEGSEKKRHFQRIHSAINMLTSMLDDISIFSKKENDRLRLHPVQIEVKDFFQTIIEETLTQFGRKNDIIYDEACSGRQHIVIDKFLLRYVVNNLLSNALKYSDSQVNLHVKCSSYGKLFIRVDDKGRGIPRKHLEHIFEPFFRSDNTETIRGTGLGLTIVKQCVDLLSGEIHIDSEINQGTTVTLEVPYQIPES